MASEKENGSTAVAVPFDPTAEAPAASHTAGPWVIKIGRTIAHIIGAGHRICSVGLHDGFKDLTEEGRNAYRARALADAHLIAWSPDLARALLNSTYALDYCLTHYVPEEDLLAGKCRRNLETARGLLAKIAA